MNLRQLDQVIAEHADWCPSGEDRLRFLSLALCGEAGELANLFKKEWRGDCPQAEVLDKARGELVDLMAYVLMTGHELKMDLILDLLPAVLAKMIEVESRPEHAHRQVKCHLCKKGPMDGVTLYRINEKGLEDIWACEAHRPPGHHIDFETRRIVAAIEGDDNG